MNSWQLCTRLEGPEGPSAAKLLVDQAWIPRLTKRLWDRDNKLSETVRNESSLLYIKIVYYYIVVYYNTNQTNHTKLINYIINHQLVSKNGVNIPSQKDAVVSTLGMFTRQGCNKPVI